jgi:hypothetical protein
MPDLSDYRASHSTDVIRSAIVNADMRPGVRKGLAKATTRDGRQIPGLVRNEDNLSLQLLALNGTFYSLGKSDLTELMFDSEPLMSDKHGSKLSKSRAGPAGGATWLSVAGCEAGWTNRDPSTKNEGKKNQPEE